MHTGITVFLAAAMTAALTGCGASTADSGSYGISLAVVAPFSGANADLGNHFNSMAYSAVGEINKDGGVLGHQIAVEDIDDLADPADALPRVQKWLAVTSHKFFVLGPDTPTGLQLAPVINQAKITMQSLAGESAFDKNSYEYFWRPATPDDANAVAVALYAKQQHLTKVATMFGTDQASQGDRPGVLAAFKHLGINDVKDLTITPGQPSYQAQVAQLLELKPQAIITESDSSTAGTFFGEVNQQSSSPIRILTTAAGLLPDYISAVRNAVGAARFADEFAALGDEAAKPSPADATYKAAILASSKNVPNPSQYLDNSHTAQGYSSVILTALAATAAHSVVSSVYNSYIPQVANPGPGKTIVYNYADGVKALNAGKHIEYVGPAGAFHFDQYHNSYSSQVAQGVTASSGTKFTRLAVISRADIQAAGG
jgi:ABC-type branched-subunit amino acid transport system substrate-binding protein